MKPYDKSKEDFLFSLLAAGYCMYEEGNLSPIDDDTALSILLSGTIKYYQAEYPWLWVRR